MHLLSMIIGCSAIASSVAVKYFTALHHGFGFAEEDGVGMEQVLMHYC
jgi:hypothetical protein